MLQPDEILRESRSGNGGGDRIWDHPLPITKAGPASVSVCPPVRQQRRVEAGESDAGRSSLLARAE